MPLKKYKTFCKRCFSSKKIEEMASNNVLGPGYKYLCKNCERLFSKEKRSGLQSPHLDAGHNGLKFCHTCEKVSPVSQFIFSHKTQGYQNKCRSCRLKYKRKYKEKNKEKIDESNRKSNIKCEKQRKEYRDNRKDKKSEYDREHRKTRKRNQKKETDRDTERRNSDSFYHTKFYLRRRIKKALNAAGYSKKSKTNEILGIDWNGLASHFLNICNIDILSKIDMKDRHVDHICPLAQAKNEEELIKLCHYTNLQILPALQNMKKSDTKTPEGEVKCRELLRREWK